MITKIHMILILIFLFPGSQVAAQRCVDWQVGRLDKAPDWYLAASAMPRASREAKLSDSLTRIDYPLKDGLTLVQYWREAYDQLDDPTSSPYVAPGSLYLYGSDTTLLDSSLCGFSVLSFSSDSTQCVAGKLQTITDHGHSSSIVLYDLQSERATVLDCWMDDSGPKFAPEWPFVAYSDKGDLYIYSLMMMSAELVFQRGGSYSTGDCARHCIRGIHWSANGDRRLVFKYYENVGDRTYDVFEVYWAPASDTASQM